MAFSIERDNLVFKAKLAEQCQRYDDMVDAIKNVGKLGLELTIVERTLLASGYKYLVGSRKASLRILSLKEQKEEAKGNELSIIRIKEYKHKVESELLNICSDLITFIDDYMIHSSTAGESFVFFNKMKGDYYRHLIDFKIGKQDMNEAIAKSLHAFQSATTAAESDLSPINPIRLRLALSFSVFCFSVMKSPERAYFLAKKAYDDAILEVDTLSEESYKNSRLIMKLLRNNLKIWTPEVKEDGEEEHKRLLTTLNQMEINKS
ncbi:14-3-3-like protein C [Impatiens glandulifera]|uniref:14-3-3-like protein C n=1 Tax=Impatiens glandulifera TaxID=253017 RepID=UPI001FB0F6CC|nr:14-3-3-like protein C [Impatiens glandulifera]